MPENVASDHQSTIDRLLGNTPTPEPTPPATPEPPVVPAEPANPPAAEPPVIPPAEPPAEPAAPTPNTPAPVNPPVNIYENLAEISGGLVKSADDFTSIVEKANKTTDLENQNRTLTEQYEALKNDDPFPNEYLKRLAQLYKEGAPQSKIDTFNRINSLGDVKELSSRDAVKWQLREKYNLSDEQAETKLNSTYKLDDTVYTEEEIKAANVDLLIAADDAKTYLSGLQASFVVQAPAPPAPQETPEQIAQKQAVFVAQITPVVKTIEQELPAYFANINVNGAQGDKAVTVDLPIPAEVQTSIATQVKQFVIDNQIDVSTPESVQGLKDYAKNLAKIQMFDAWMIEVNSQRDIAIRAEFHNPDNISRGQDNPASPQVNNRSAIASSVADRL